MKRVGPPTGSHAVVILDILKAQIAKGEKINRFNEENMYFILVIGVNKVCYKLRLKIYKHLKFYTAIHPSTVLGS